MNRTKECHLYKKNKENNIRYIRAKLPCASDKALALVAAFIQGFDIIGFDYDEYNRPIVWKGAT